MRAPYCEIIGQTDRKNSNCFTSLAFYKKLAFAWGFALICSTDAPILNANRKEWPAYV